MTSHSAEWNEFFAKHSKVYEPSDLPNAALIGIVKTQQELHRGKGVVSEVSSQDHSSSSSSKSERPNSSGSTSRLVSESLGSQKQSSSKTIDQSLNDRKQEEEVESLVHEE